ncbi:MAG: hypothetical protein J1G04_05810, partial [Clostridiales bacterium]|nr:hypothetical protein [Clostridiales bacterium]
MQKQTIRKNYILILLVTALLAVVSLLAVFALRGTDRAYAAVNEGNEAVSPTGAPEITPFILDVNGKSAEKLTTGLEQTADAITANNANNFSVRRLSSSAVVQAYNTKHDTNLVPNEYYFVIAGASGAQSGRVDSGYNSIRVDSSKFTVTVEDSTTYMTVTALAATSSTEFEHFSVQLGKRRDGNGLYYGEFITVYFNVRITDSFLQFDNRPSSEFLLVGNDLITSPTAETDATKTPVHKPILRLENNSQIKISLADVLKNHILYELGDNDANNYIKPVLMEETNSTSYWGVNSVNNFVISNIDFNQAIDNAIMNDTNSPSADPTVTAKLAITTYIINNYCQRVKPDLRTEAERSAWFWADNTVHNIQLELGQRGQPNKSFTILIPVQFIPANPLRRNVDKNRFSLNVLSQYTFDLANSKMLDGDVAADTSVTTAEGYKSIIVRPTDLVEYSAPESYATNRSDYTIMSFDAATTSGFGLDVDNVNTSATRYENEYYMIEKIMDTDADGIPRRELENDFPDAFKITAKSNAFVNITLGVSYYVATGRCSIENDIRISIPLNCYGNYVVTIPDINNKKGITYNVLTSDIFGELLDAGFQMNSVESLNTDQLSAQFKDNMLTLTPLVDRINGQTTARIRMEFTNSSSQKIVIISDLFAIDIKAQDFFSLFDADWKAWLTIAGIALGGIIIILLIVWLFIHSISKHKQDVAATQAPVSSYIVKLNSTIAATQAQRMAATQPFAPSATGNQMLLSAPSATPAADPNTLQLASGSGESTTDTSSSTTEPKTSEPRETVNENDEKALYDKIAEYISDDELLERIFKEKYEPKGMVRRTFFKSKDL